jgi:hypothetical protein
MAVRILAAHVLLLLLASVVNVKTQNVSLVVTAGVFEKLKALFAMKEENYISRQGERLLARQKHETTKEDYLFALHGT